MRLLLCSLLVISLIVAINSAYAYTETIDLPREDYISKFCHTQIQIYAFPQWVFHQECDFVFEETLSFPMTETPSSAVIIEPIRNDPNPSGSLMMQLQDFIDAVTQSTPDNLIGLPSETPSDNLTTDQIEKLEECLRGYDRNHSWGAFVDTSVIDGWQNATRENFVMRDGLSKHPTELAAIKAIEECNAIARYVFLGKIGEREANMAFDDRNDIGQRGEVAQLTRGNEPSLGFQDEGTATDAKIREQEKLAHEYSCSEENKARKLCSDNGYGKFFGVNRGISQPLVSKDVVNQFTGKTAVDIMAEAARLKAASIWTEQDAINYQKALEQTICDSYLPQYKHRMGADDFPDWLRHCLP